MKEKNITISFFENENGPIFYKVDEDEYELLSIADDKYGSLYVAMCEDVEIGKLVKNIQEDSSRSTICLPFI